MRPDMVVVGEGGERNQARWIAVLIFRAWRRGYYIVGVRQMLHVLAFGFDVEKDW